MDNKEITIIGGGISGLASAYYLSTASEMPLRIRLLEAAPHLGGTILTERVNGFIIEGGPDCFISEKPAVLNLSKEAKRETPLHDGGE